MDSTGVSSSPAAAAEGSSRKRGAGSSVVAALGAAGGRAAKVQLNLIGNRMRLATRSASPAQQRGQQQQEQEANNTSEPMAVDEESSSASSSGIFDVCNMPRDNIFPRTLHSWSVHCSVSTSNWIATIARPKTNPTSQSDRNHQRYLQFPFRSEREARRFCKAYAPPKLDVESTCCRSCQKNIINNNSNSGSNGNTGTTSTATAMAAAKHCCRNCGVMVCDTCSTKWGTRMVPKTYILLENMSHRPSVLQSTVRVCKSCDWLSNAFCMALLQGRYDDAINIHETGNVNLRTSFADINGEAMFPVHCAVMGGSLELVRWLVETQLCPISVTTRDTALAPQSWLSSSRAGGVGGIGSIGIGNSTNSNTPSFMGSVFIAATGGGGAAAASSSNNNASSSIGAAAAAAFGGGSQQQQQHPSSSSTTATVRRNLTSVQTSASRTLLDLAMSGNRVKVDILVFLIQKGLSINDVKNPALASKTLEMILRNGGLGLNLGRISSNGNNMMNVNIVDDDDDDDDNNNKNKNVRGGGLLRRGRSQGYEAAAAASSVEAENDGDDDTDAYISEAASTSMIEDACNLCCEKPMDCVLTPCGHQMCCTDCAKQLRVCPVCKVECVPLRIFRP